MRQLIPGVSKYPSPSPLLVSPAQFQRDASNPTASITFQPSDASLCTTKVPQTPGTTNTHLGPATDAAVGSNPHKQHEMNTLTWQRSHPTTQLFLPKAKGMFQTPNLLAQTPQVPSHRSNAQTLPRHELCWSPPGPPASSSASFVSKSCSLATTFFSPLLLSPWEMKKYLRTETALLQGYI